MTAINNMATTSNTSNLVIRVPVDVPEGDVECCDCCETEDLRVVEIHNSTHVGDLVWVCKCCYNDDQDDGCHYNLIGDDWVDWDEDEDEDEDEAK